MCIYIYGVDLKKVVDPSLKYMYVWSSCPFSSIYITWELIFSLKNTSHPLEKQSIKANGQYLLGESFELKK